MQTRQTLTVPPPAPTAHGCGCEGDTCNDTCCSLGTLLQPRFFCGQLLTDRDLTALVDWTGDKLRLGRYRHGWGAVCGLDVRCEPDPDRQPGVIVTPGYAVTCCGNDVVVATDHHVDLAGVCRPEPDPCEDPYRRDPAPSGNEEQTGRRRLFRRGLAGALSPEGDPEELRVVDLTICYRTEAAEPQPALAHGVCGEGGACDHSRTRELFTVVPRLVRGSGAPVSAADTWAETYGACLKLIDDFQRYIKKPVAQADPADVKRWLLARTLHHFCLLYDRVCELKDEQLKSEQVIAELLFGYVQDCRNQFLTCSCHACQDDQGVPLARVWMRSRPDKGGRCQVLAIDNTPPYRRPLAVDCWPAPPGEVNVARVLWHRWEQACTELADLGVEITGKVGFEIPGTLDGLKDALDCSPFVPCGEPRIVQVLDMGELGQRVVGFCGVQPKGWQPAPAPDQTTHPEAEPASEADADFTEVRGIGPNHDRTLKEAGVRTWSDLADASVERLRPLFPPFVQLDRWIAAARERVGR
jgi:hypothetical protein